MHKPQVVTATEWQQARDELLKAEKEATHALDALAARRRRLPMVTFDRAYVFEGPDGTQSLLDLFDGRRQLVVYQFMDNGPDDYCPGCTAFTNNAVNLASVNARDTTYVGQVGPQTQQVLHRGTDRRTRRERIRAGASTVSHNAGNGPDRPRPATVVGDSRRRPGHRRAYIFGNEDPGSTRSGSHGGQRPSGRRTCDTTARVPRRKPARRSCFAVWPIPLEGHSWKTPLRKRPRRPCWNAPKPRATVRSRRRAYDQRRADTRTAAPGSDRLQTTPFPRR